MTATDTKRGPKTVIAGALLVACCVAGPAILGAIGGAATGSVVLGAVVAACIAGVVYMVIRMINRRRPDAC
jgi:hypothetical protein